MFPCLLVSLSTCFPGSAIHRRHLRSHRRPGEALGVDDGGLAEALGQARLAQHPQDGLSQGGRIVGRGQQRIDAVVHHLRHPAHGRGHDGQAQRRGLQQGVGLVIHGAGADEEVGGA